MTIPTQAEIDDLLDDIESELEGGATADDIVRSYWRDALDGGWLGRFRVIGHAFDGGSFDHELLERLLPELDHRARRAPDAGLDDG